MSRPNHSQVQFDDVHQIIADLQTEITHQKARIASLELEADQLRQKLGITASNYIETTEQVAVLEQQITGLKATNAAQSNYIENLNEKIVAMGFMNTNTIQALSTQQTENHTLHAEITQLTNQLSSMGVLFMAVEKTIEGVRQGAQRSITHGTSKGGLLDPTPKQQVQAKERETEIRPSSSHTGKTP